jgi:hypothetical protein
MPIPIIRPPLTGRSRVNAATRDVVVDFYDWEP